MLRYWLRLQDWHDVVSLPSLHCVSFSLTSIISLAAGIVLFSVADMLVCPLIPAAGALLTGYSEWDRAALPVATKTFYRTINATFRSTLSSTMYWTSGRGEHGEASWQSELG